MTLSLTPYERALVTNGVRLPCVLSPIRTERGRELRKAGVEVFANRYLAPRTDGMANTLTTVQKDNLILTYKPT